MLPAASIIPNIVTVHALKPGQDATVYLVMEYLPGGSLRTLLDHRGRLTGGVTPCASRPRTCATGWPRRAPRGSCTATSSRRHILLTADVPGEESGTSGSRTSPACRRRRLPGRTDGPSRLPARDADLTCRRSRFAGRRSTAGATPTQCGALLRRDADRAAAASTSERLGRDRATGDGRRQRLAHAGSPVRPAWKRRSADRNRRTCVALRPDVPGWLGATVAASVGAGRPQCGPRRSGWRESCGTGRKRTWMR